MHHMRYILLTTLRWTFVFEDGLLSSVSSLVLENFSFFSLHCIREACTAIRYLKSPKHPSRI